MSSHHSDQFNSSLPEGFNLPSPLPLPSSIADSVALRNSSPNSTFSFSPTHTQLLEQARNSNNSQEESVVRLPPSVSATYPLIPSTAATAVTSTTSSVSASSFHHDTNRVHQPAFYTSSFRVSNMYSQQPPCASWATHPLHTFNPFYSPPNRAHIHQQSLPPPSQPPFFPSQLQPLPQPQNLNFGLHYRERPGHMYQDMSVFNPAMFQAQQHHAMMQYSARQRGMMMVQSLRSPFNQQYQHIMNPAPLPVPPSQALGIGVSQRLPPRYSELFPTPPGLPPTIPGLSPSTSRLPLTAARLAQTPPRQQVPWTSCSSTTNFSGVTPERYLISEEREIVGVHGPESSSMVQTPLRSCPPGSVQPQPGHIDVAITSTQSKLQLASTDNQQVEVIVSSSLTVPRPAKAPSKTTSSIIRPIPIRPLPPPSVFSWPRPALYSTPRISASPSTPVNVTTSQLTSVCASPSTPESVATSQLTPVCEEEKSPIEQIKKSLGNEKRKDVKAKTKANAKRKKVKAANKANEKRKAATKTNMKLPVDVPCYSGGNSGHEQTLQEEIIISEGDMDVGEQVVVETYKQASSRIVAKDKKLEEYKSFVSSFKSYRVSLNYSLVDVIHQVGCRYGRRITLRLITDFEDLVLDKKSYTPLMGILRLWMKDTAKENIKSIPTLQYHSIIPLCFRKRKARVNTLVTHGLEEVFAQKSNPTLSEVKKMAEKWKVDRDFIRNWFCDRRRRERKHMTTHVASAQGLDWSVMPLQVEGSKIPSSLYDITIEVSSYYPRDQWSSPYAVCI